MCSAPKELQQQQNLQKINEKFTSYPSLWQKTKPFFKMEP